MRSRSDLFDRARTPIDFSPQRDVAKSIGVLALSNNSLLERTSRRRTAYNNIANSISKRASLALHVHTFAFSQNTTTPQPSHAAKTPPPSP